MKKGFIIVVSFLALFFLGCPAKVVVPPRPEVPATAQKETAQRLFDAAEQYFSRDELATALGLYQQYMAQFATEPMADRALMQIGNIHATWRQYDKARTAFERLLRDYPDSPWYLKARIGLIRTYFGQQDYETVLRKSGSMLQTTLAPDDARQLYDLAGDSHLALGQAGEAVGAYALALELTPETQRPQALSKLKEAIDKLDIVETQTRLGQVTTRTAHAYLLFHLGLRQAEAERFEAALKTLTTFVTAYPNHENTQLARDLLAELNQRAGYERHTLGVLLPLSGRYGAIGHKALRGIELALHHFNQNQELKDLRLVVKDTAADPDTARAAVKELAREKVAAVVGPLITAAAAAQEAQEQGLPIITMTQKEGIAETGDFVFRNFITPGMQVRTLAEYITKTLNVKRVAILYPEDKYGQVFMNLFWDELLQNGATVVALEHYNTSHTDFADPIKKLVGLYYPLPYFLKRKLHLLEVKFDYGEEDPGDAAEDEAQDNAEEPQAIVDFDAVFIPDEPKTAGLVIPQLAFYDISNVYLVGTNLWHSPKFIEMAPDYIRRAIIPDGFFAHSTSPWVRAYVDDFKTIYGETPGFIESIAYDSAAILLDMVKRPEVLFRSTIAETLRALFNYDGVTGKTTFDGSGEAQKALYLLRVKGNQFVEIENTRDDRNPG